MALRPVHERDGYPTYWPRDPERFIAEKASLGAWVAVLGDEVVGHVSLGRVDGRSAYPEWCEATGVHAERLAVIARLFVSPAARGTGAGGALLAAALTEADRRGLAPVLDVTRDNADTIAFYERRGWRRVGAATLDLRDPPGATLAMWLYVGPNARPLDVASAGAVGAPVAAPPTAAGASDVGPAAALDIAALEDVAARAVPALEAVEVGGWLLRATPRVGTRRPNSVLARADDPDSALLQRIDAVERFYADRDQPARFQLTPASRPVDLETTLRARGYVRESPTLVRVGETATLAGGENAAEGMQVRIEANPGPVWLATWCEALGIELELQGGPRALWNRIGSECAFALVVMDGTPAGVGMAVRDGRWVGIFNLATLSVARRRGVAQAALRALAVWGMADGATRAYLQVDAANDSALALYERAGMHAAYEYVYLVQSR